MEGLRKVAVADRLLVPVTMPVTVPSTPRRWAGSPICNCLMGLAQPGDCETLSGPRLPSCVVLRFHSRLGKSGSRLRTKRNA